MSFKNLGLAAALQKALEAQQMSTATPIQQDAIPAILAKKDVLGIAQTGSGKTASFVLPILTLLQHAPKPTNRHPQALILVPTRELAAQVHGVFEVFAAALAHPLKTMMVHGGVSINPQMMHMNNVQILVATPGRLLELADAKAVHLADVQLFVLDEADKMLNLGFEDEMKRIIAMLPRHRQNLLFSATLNEKVEAVNQLVLHNPVVIKIAAERENLDLIKQEAYFVDDDKKGVLLRHLLKNEDIKQVLIFTSSIYKADHVSDKLKKNGIDARATHSKKSQGARTEALKLFKSGGLRVLVATDLLSRGIDVAFLPCVINYDLPRSPQDFVHRIGRTGRAENPGLAISFVSPEEEHHFKIIQKKMKQWPERYFFNDLEIK